MGSGSSKPSQPPAVEAVSTPLETPTNNTDSSPSTPKEQESACPMKRSDGSYSFDWGALFRKDFPHGPAGSKPISEEEAAQRVSQCPVRKSEYESSASASRCPVRYQPQQTEYNVYSQPLDPSNNMPKVANQLPAAGQTKALSTHRVSSSIPKGGAKEGTTWTYPSPQMFYNALARKGKLGSEDTQAEEEQDMMETVVALHNDMNEKSWKKVLQWEAVVAGQKDSASQKQTTVSNSDVGRTTKLLKFEGRPSDLSPKAWIKHNLLGHPLPFDRHDWVVLRPDGTTVRYILDYYYNDDPSAAEGSGSSQTLLVDVRPALDGPAQLWARMGSMPLARHVFNSTSFVPLPMSPPSGMKTQVSESIRVWQDIQASVAASKLQQPKDETAEQYRLSAADAKALVEDVSRAARQCHSERVAVSECDSEDACANASMDLTLCLGKYLCALQHDTLIEALQQDKSEATVDAALERLNDCVTLKSKQQAAARQQHPTLFQQHKQ